MKKIVLGLLRISMGWIFLWSFLDKLFGLGFPTESGKSWLDGNSPTLGFLKFGTAGPLSDFYKNIAGNTFVDWIYMIGLLLIGLALLLGVGLRIAAVSGSLMMLLVWSAYLPPEYNPIIDEHIVYIMILIILPIYNSGNWLGLGRWWSNTKCGDKYSFLK